MSPPQMRRDTCHGPRHDGRLDTDIPAFGDVVGLRRLYRAAVENIRQMEIPEAHKGAWIEELTRQYRAATRTASPGASATPAGQGGN